MLAGRKNLNKCSSWEKQPVSHFLRFFDYKFQFSHAIHVNFAISSYITKAM